MTMGWYRYDENNYLVLTVHIQPNAKNTEIAGLYGAALKIKLAAPAIEGKANAALLRFLAQRLNVSLSSVILRQGDKSRRKIVVVQQQAKNPFTLLE